jgi:hypothetical protein
MIIFSPGHPQGEVFADLPKDGLFYPAIQNKSKIIAPNTLRVDYKFELPIPIDRSAIWTANYSSDEDNTFAAAVQDDS